MQNVSFGRVLKVNAPIRIAEEIIKTAKTDTELGYTLNRTLFPNKRGNAHTYTYSENKNESYIFTENDGLKFWKSHCRAWDEMDYAHSYYGIDPLADIATEAAWERHFNNVKKIINAQSGKIVKLNTEYNKENGEIKSINIIV